MVSERRGLSWVGGGIDHELCYSRIAVGINLLNYYPITVYFQSHICSPAHIVVPSEYAIRNRQPPARSQADRLLRQCDLAETIYPRC